MAVVAVERKLSRKQMMKAKMAEKPAKHIPQRTCIACRKTSAKRELVRLVRAGDGSVEIDITGKRSGRGAYLCSALECWNAVLNSGKLEYALNVRIKPENKDNLANYARDINNTDGIKRS